MKVCVAQLNYSRDFSRRHELFEQELALFDQCDESMDLIVFPEYSDLPVYAADYEEFMACQAEFHDAILQKAQQTARRCQAMLFINAVSHTPTGMRNTTWAFDRQGQVAGKYDKQHLIESEMSVYKMDGSYTFEYQQPTVVEMEGLRFGFLTCYDFYFYEMYSAIARQNVDIVIGCAYQRSDKHSAIETMSRFCAYNCNAYLLRSSVSMGDDSPVGGSSLIAAPDGELLGTMDNQVGLMCREIDPSAKYLKPAGFGNPPSPHWRYAEKGRRPWKYRPAGPAIVLGEDRMGYPRICAHRGFSSIAPENSMPAFGAAIASGAEEIEFDLWTTADGEIVSIHDQNLDRVSTGTGKVTDHTYAELLQYDFGAPHAPEFEGLRILRFEDILKKLTGQVIMNIHIKPDDNKEPFAPFNRDSMDKILALIEQYDAQKHCYIMSTNDAVLAYVREKNPGIALCAGHQGFDPYGLVDRAIRFGYEKVQLFKPYFNQEMIDKARAHGVKLNVFFSDDAEETRRYLDMGVDTILTNDYQRTANAVKQWLSERK